MNRVLENLGSKYQAQPNSPIEYSVAALAEVLERKFRELERELKDPHAHS